MIPILVLSASLDLDGSSVFALMGNPSAAMESAKRAAAAALDSGWAKGQIVSAVNLAQFLTSEGRFSDAEHQITLARRIGFTHVSQEIALIDTEAQIAVCRGLLDKAETLLLHGRRLAESAPRWYALCLEATQNRQLIRRAKYAEVEREQCRMPEDCTRGRGEQLCCHLRIAASRGTNRKEHYIELQHFLHGRVGTRPVADAPRR